MIQANAHVDDAPLRVPTADPRTWVLRVSTVFGGLVAGVVAAFLGAVGLWYVALGLLLSVPVFVLLHRYPLAAVSIWVFLAPFVVVTDSATFRQAYWLVHRLLPAATLAIVVMGPRLGVTRRRLPRLGWAEILIGGYVAATLLSIWFASPEPVAMTILFYDRAIAPILLYLVIRLVGISNDDARWFVPATVFLLLTQTAIGLMGWWAPAALPSAWTVHAGERTTGTFRDPNVFGVSVLFAGLLLLHYGVVVKEKARRAWFVGLSILAFWMVFMTFSRANWIVLALVVTALMVVQRPHFHRLVLGIIPVLAVLTVLGVFSTQFEWASQRLDSAQSEESALSRLPVVYASVRMFAARPITGWGYENFDEYDRDFQAAVGDLVYPNKDHASHNFYLTTLAEQGLIGLLLFMSPVVYWLVRTARTLPRFSRRGFVSRQLVLSLWLVLLGHVVVNNFSRMQVPFGLGMWWVVLGMIAALVADAARVPTRRRPLRSEAV